jgi:hypothetical protein
MPPETRCAPIVEDGALLAAAFEPWTREPNLDDFAPG